jgi:hypothetical protein
MADTHRERIIQALMGRLSTVGIPVYRERRSPLTENALPALVLFDEGNGAPDFSVSSLVAAFEMTVAVELYCRGTSDAAAAAARNDLYGRVMLAVADGTLGGLSIDIAEGAFSPQTDPTPGAPGITGWRLELTVSYETVAGDPYTQA